MKPTTKIKFTKIKNGLSKRSPLIMTALGIAGSIGAVATAFKVAPKAADVLKQVKENNPDLSKGRLLWEETKAVAPLVWPTVVMEATSIGCALCSYKINTKRLSTLAAAYALSESRFSDYQNQVIKQIGKTKEQKVRDAVDAEHVQERPLGKNNEVVLLPNETLCYDSLSGRYFKSDMESLKRIENALNQRLQTEMYISLNEFYYELQIPEIELGDELGWNIRESLIHLDFSSTVAENGQPVLVVNYRVAPRYNFADLH